MTGVGMVVFHNPANPDRAKPFIRAAEELNISIDIIPIDFEGSLRNLSEFVIAPEIIVIDLNGEEEPMAALDRIAEVAPENEFDLIMIGVENDARLYRKLRGRAVADIFDTDPEDEEVLESLRRIHESRENVGATDPRKVVFVWSACGGAGGTTVAVSMARKYASMGKRTLLLDLDTFGGGVSFALDHSNGARETPALIEALQTPERVDALFLNRAVFSTERNLSYLSVRHDGKLNVAESAIGTIISRAQASFEMVVVEIPWRGIVIPSRRDIVGLNIIVAPLTPPALLGYGVIRRIIDGVGRSADVCVMINRSSETFATPIQAKDFTQKSSELVLVPYDATSMAKSAVDDKSMFEAGGKLGRAMKDFERRFITGGKSGGFSLMSLFGR